MKTSKAKAEKSAPKKPVADPKPKAAPPPATRPDGSSGSYSGNQVFIDRELSWLAFNRRVLEEAQDRSIPLLERLKFLGIVGSNLDEFFEVRVAALLQRVEAGLDFDGIAQIDAREKLGMVLKECQAMVRDQYGCWHSLRESLKGEGVFVKKMRELTADEETFVHDYFRREVYHLLTPIKVDPSHPFPWVVNKSLCLAFLLKDGGRGRESLGVVSVPRSLPRVVALPQTGTDYAFIFISDIVRHYGAELFKGYPIHECSSFRVTRNSNLYMEDEEDEVENLLESVEEGVRNRRKGDVVRLEIDEDASPKLTQLLVGNFEIEDNLIFHVGKPVNLNRVFALYGLIPLPHLKYPSFHPTHPPGLEESEAIFDRLRSRDILLHHPFESFDPVVRFIESVAHDPQVMAIKTTLYRTSANSPIMFALMEAAQRGKEVVVVVELKARFDEQSNIHWARRLEERGGTVVYGLVGLKTHCKLALILRKEEGVFRRYAHIGTGNYNPDTARLYTDLSLMTGDATLTEGVSEVFNFLTANARDTDFRGLWVSPRTFLSGTLAAIQRERDNARKGLPSGIVAKFNALLDREVIEALYQASRDGVEIRLMVRGICSLRPQAPGLSENIRIKSVVGRYLEHSRIYCFRNAGDPEIFLGSGDWMVRNLRERVEVIIPVRDADLKQRLLQTLSVYWHEEGDTRWMNPNGRYHRAAKSGQTKKMRAQDWFMRQASGRGELHPVPPLWEQGPAKTALGEKAAPGPAEASPPA